MLCILKYQIREGFTEKKKETFALLHFGWDFRVNVMVEILLTGNSQVAVWITWLIWVIQNIKKNYNKVQQ